METITPFYNYGNPPVPSKLPGLVIPPHGLEFTVVSQVKAKYHKGPIERVEYVREAITEEPVFLVWKVRPMLGGDRLILTNEQIASFIKDFLTTPNSWFYLSEDGFRYGSSLEFRTSPRREPCLGIGYDPEDRIEPRILERILTSRQAQRLLPKHKLEELLKDFTLQARLIIQSHVEVSGIISYTSGGFYDTSEITKLLIDPNFDFKRLRHDTTEILERAKRHLPPTRMLGQYLIVGSYS